MSAIRVTKRSSTAARQITRQQRLGPGLIWTPSAGAILQNQTNSADAAWGTRAAGADQVYEAANLPVRFSTREPRPGSRDLDPGVLMIEYPLAQTGRKRVVFEHDAIRVSIEHPGEFTEQIPALGTGIRMQPDPAAAVGTQARVGGKPVRVLRLPAKDRLEYAIVLR
ncbi:MAG TPA: hypothetical protein VFL57_08130 [Bryobacteraceae bacterium]|nr:hypothetical protein [Bryobacteraceae bacterium]